LERPLLGVDVEGDFNLRHATRGRRDVREVKLADGLVVAGERALSLEHVNLDAGLIIRSGGENLRFARGNCRVAFDQFGEHAAEGFDAERKRCHVEQQHVLDFAFEHAALDACTHGHDLVGIHALMRLFVHE